MIGSSLVDLPHRLDEAQIEGKGKFTIEARRLDLHLARCVADLDKTRQAPTFGLERVHRESIVIAPARMSHVILATAQ